VSPEADQAVAERIVRQARQELTARLRGAILRQAGSATEPMTLEASQLDELVDAAAARAGGVLWRRCLASAAIGELGVELADAISHHTVRHAHELAGAPPFEGAAPAAPVVPVTPAHRAGDADASLQALRIAAVHVSGIESLRNGERDLELRFSDAGLDLLKASSGAAIGRLLWSDIHSVEVASSRRGLRPGRRVPELQVRAQSGRATFQLPKMNSEQVNDYLEPVLARLREAGGRS
jgi:hypothetical protein